MNMTATFKPKCGGWPRYKMPLPADVVDALEKRDYSEPPHDDDFAALMKKSREREIAIINSPPSEDDPAWAGPARDKAWVDKIAGTEASEILAKTLLGIRGLQPDEILRRWIPIALLLSKSEAAELIAEVSRLTDRGKRVLSADLAEARRKKEIERTLERAEQQAHGRKLIEYNPSCLTKHALEIEQMILDRAAPGEYVDFGGALSHIAYQQLPYTHEIDDEDGHAPEVPQLAPLSEVDVLGMTEAVVALCTVNSKGVAVPMAVPERIVNIILKKSEHKAPRIAGLVTHPLVLPNGEILAVRGLHKSGLFLACESIDGLRPYSRNEAAAALLRLRSEFLEGFEFASEIDSLVAVGGLLTGVQRRWMDMAPGLAILAAVQSSGKTTLARRIHVLLTGRDMPVSSFPPNDESEVGKRLLAMLLRGPAMVCFDNVMDGMTFRSGAISSAMTGAIYEQRILGMTRDAACPTNVLFCLTGNNISLGPDEVTRWMTTRLAPQTARPESRRFKHPDVVGYALGIRDGVLRDVIGIVAGYLNNGASLAPSTRFVQWDSMVRQPLLWAGGGDIAQVFDNNNANAEHVLALESLIADLAELFGEERFNAAKVSAAASAGDGIDVHGRLRTALENLRASDVTKPRSVAHVLGAQAGRIAVIDGAAKKIEQIVERPEIFYRIALVPQ